MRVNPKIRGYLEKVVFIYVIISALVSAVYFKSGNVYAKEVPTFDVKHFSIKPSKKTEQQVTKEQEVAIQGIMDIYDPPKGNRFPWGQCTWYVATKRNVTWNGNARNWYTNAKRAGRPVGKTPKVGSIIVLNQGYYGHVGYVEKIEGNIITYSESNNPRPGRITRQTVDYRNLPVIGFIY